MPACQRRVKPIKPHYGKATFGVSFFPTSAQDQRRCRGGRKAAIFDFSDPDTRLWFGLSTSSKSESQSPPAPLDTKAESWSSSLSVSILTPGSWERSGREGAAFEDDGTSVTETLHSSPLEPFELPLDFLAFFDLIGLELADPG